MCLSRTGLPISKNCSIKPLKYGINNWHYCLLIYVHLLTICVEYSVKVVVDWLCNSCVFVNTVYTTSLWIFKFDAELVVSAAQFPLI